MKKLFALLVMALFATTACININIGTEETPIVEEEVVEESSDPDLAIMEEFNLTKEEVNDLKQSGIEGRDAVFYYLDELNAMGPGPFDINGELEDVSGGNATGYAGASILESGKYYLYVTFDDLPNPEEGFFYEGWVVKKPFSVISTGPAERVLGKYHNAYESETDLLDHDFYVLTIEPDDGNPDPADHVLEGTME